MGNLGTAAAAVTFLHGPIYLFKVARVLKNAFKLRLLQSFSYKFKLRGFLAAITRWSILLDLVS